MTQLPLIDRVPTVASRLCRYDPPCQPRGRMVRGEFIRVATDCDNREIHCLTCDRRGLESRNLLHQRKA